MTIILGKSDRVHYYYGDGLNEEKEPVKYDLKTTDFSGEGIRSEIKKHLYEKGNGLPRCQGKNTEGCWDPIIVLKPMDKSRYKNLVDILDEMSITDARKYALTKISEVDSTLLLMNGYW